MKRRNFILFGLLFIGLSNIIIGNLAITIGDKQSPEQSTETQTTTTIIESKIDLITTTTIEPLGRNSFSLILTLFLFLFSPLLGILFLFLGMNYSFGQTAPGFEIMSFLPLLLFIGSVYLITRRRSEK